MLRATFGMVNFIITIIRKDTFIFQSVLLLSSLFLNTVIKLCTTYLSVCACACVHVPLLIQYAMRVRHVVTSCLAPLAPPNF